jgi:hypothetical protein
MSAKLVSDVGGCGAALVAGCPSWERALQILRAEMTAVGLDPGTIEMSEIETDVEAERRGFPGSPTIRINGRDIQPLGSAESHGLTCRVYHLRAGESPRCRIRQMCATRFWRAAIAKDRKRERS